MTKRIEDLECDGLVIVQDDNNYCFTTDSVLLANFFKAKKDQVVVEFCAGGGVISILGTKKTNAKHFYCFEIQKELANMFCESIKLNNISNISVINDDLKNAQKYLSVPVDVVVVNPPYYTNKETSENSKIATATHEVKTSLEQICQTASKILKFGGKFYMVHIAERFAEICSNLRENNLEPKRVVFVKPTKNKQPNVVLIEATKGAKVGLKIEELVCQNADGTMTESLKKIYNK